MAEKVIAFAGASHTGKTLLAEDTLTYIKKEKGLNAFLVPFCGFSVLQEIVKKEGKPLQVNDYEIIFDSQVDVEKKMLEKQGDWAIVENSLFSCYVWCFSNAIYNKVYCPEKHREIFYRMSQEARRISTRYDIIFYLPAIENSLYAKAKKMRGWLDIEKIMQNDLILQAYAKETGISKRNSWKRIEPFEGASCCFEGQLGAIEKIVENYCLEMRGTHKDDQEFLDIFTKK